MREWLPRTDQSIRANPFLTRAAQGTGVVQHGIARIGDNSAIVLRCIFAKAPAPPVRPPTMSDIFISYAREDRAKVKPLAEALARRGWKVWWDPTIPTGRPLSSGH